MEYQEKQADTLIAYRPVTLFALLCLLTSAGGAVATMRATALGAAYAFFTALFRFNNIPNGKANNYQQRGYNQCVFHTLFTGGHLIDRVLLLKFLIRTHT